MVLAISIPIDLKQAFRIMHIRFLGNTLQAIMFPSETGWTVYAHPELAHDFQY